MTQNQPNRKTNTKIEKPLLSFIQQELEWLQSFIRYRLQMHFDLKKTGEGQVDMPTLDIDKDNSPYARFLHLHQLNPMERLILILALTPHLSPNLLDDLIRSHLKQAGDFPQIGGAKGKSYRGFLPTGETAMFLLAGKDMEGRAIVQQLFNNEHLFYKKRVLWLEEVPAGEPKMSGKIILSQEKVDLFTEGKIGRPRFSMSFPAQLLETQMDWQDLVLNDKTLGQIKELMVWVNHGKTLLDDWGMRKRIKPGYRVLFYGPPGTGKTLTASLLGKYTGKDVYRVDLSMVVSKYIGETEKNLSNLFARAENKDWILFFDEADALFGKRTNVRDAHDKYANQEVAYLLQRVEGYDGLVILASNFKSNIDDAFMRRFQSIIHFPQPKASERLQLWRQSFPEKVELTAVDLTAIAKKYDLTGAGIISVVQTCCLEALSRDEVRVTEADIIKGIRKEFMKEGRILHK